MYVYIYIYIYTHTCLDVMAIYGLCYPQAKTPFVRSLRRASPGRSRDVSPAIRVQF